MNFLRKLISKEETENNLKVEYYILDNKYKTVKIGNQEWMVENLNIDHFRNGDPIPEAKHSDWLLEGLNKKPVWCYYNDNLENGEMFGKLYNWYSINDQRGLAPIGWHIPSNTEWEELIDFLGGDKEAGKKMKSTTGWDERSKKANNKSGFAGLPGGFLQYHDFRFIGELARWWSSTEIESHSQYISSQVAYCFNVDMNKKTIFKCDFHKENGASVRCIRDTEIISIIEVGMSYDEVVKIIGLPTQNRSTTATDIYGNNIPIGKETDIFQYFEKYPECNFSIHFSHDKVISVKNYPKNK